MVELHARFSCTAIAATCALAGLEVRPRGSTHARIKFYDPPGNVYVVEKKRQQQRRKRCEHTRRAAACDIAGCSQLVNAHALEPPSADGQPRERRSSAAEGTPVALASPLPLMPTAHALQRAASRAVRIREGTCAPSVRKLQKKPLFSVRRGIGKACSTCQRCCGFREILCY